MPDFTNIKTDLITFVILTAFFHALFIWIYKLGKIGWKLVDYVWLALAVVGAFGTIAESAKARMNLNLKERYEESAGVLQTIKSHAEFGSQLPRIIEFSNKNNLQWYTNVHKKDAEVYSDWCRSLKVQLTNISTSKIQAFEYFKRSDPSLLEVSDRDLSRQITKTIFDLATYNANINEIARLREEMKSQEYRILSSKVWSPLLLIIAIALRFAKATGEVFIEIEAEKRKH